MLSEEEQGSHGAAVPELAVLLLPELLAEAAARAALPLVSSRAMGACLGHPLVPEDLCVWRRTGMVRSRAGSCLESWRPKLGGRRKNNQLKVGISVLDIKWR